MSFLSLPPPSSAEVRKAVEEDTTSNKCRTLVLRVLTFGTTVVHDETSSLQERTNVAVTVLTDAWEECPVLEDVLVDCLWLCSSILSTSPDTETSTTAFIEILKSLLQVPDRTSFWTKLQCNLVPILLEASGLASEQELLKKLKIHNTQVHYKQQKYNLLQEESEGYSKVLHFLVSGCHQQEDANQQLSRLRQLIGAFELDPNRVLDILLDVLEAKLYPSELDSSSSSSVPAASKQQESSSGQLSKRRRPSTKDDPNISWLLDLVKDFSADKVPPLIGFKLTGKEKEGHVSAHLEQTIAFLATEHVLDLTIMVQEYLPPIADQIHEAYEVHWAKEKLRLQSLGRLSLTSTPKEDPKQTELEQRLEQLLKALVNSQVVRLLLTLLDWYEWDLVKPLLSREQWSKLCTLFPDKFGFALCDLAQAKVQHWSSSRVFTISLLPSTPNDETTAATTPISQPLDVFEADEMTSELTLDMVVGELSDQLLCTVQSCCIKSRPVLFCLVCRLFHSLLSSLNENNDDAGSQIQLSHDAFTFFKEFMVPSLSLFPSNPAISTELWSVLKCLPYPIRYGLYRNCMGVDLRIGTSSTIGTPLLQVESDMKAGQGTRYTLRRLSKENVRDNGRTLSKIAQSNPHVVYATILSQIESYDNMVGMMVDSQRFASALSLDVLGYCILSRLSGMAGGVKRNRLKGMKTKSQERKQARYSSLFLHSFSLHQGTQDC
jgi:THO complex subunit 2